MMMRMMMMMMNSYYLCHCGYLADRQFFASYTISSVSWTENAFTGVFYLNIYYSYEVNALDCMKN